VNSRALIDIAVDARLEYLGLRLACSSTKFRRNDPWKSGQIDQAEKSMPGSQPKRTGAHTVPPGLGAATVLWIDDEVAPRDGSVTILNRAGIAVQCASTAREGLAAAKANPPSAIILDLRLPDMDGLNVLSLLLAQHAPERVLILTGYADLEAARLAGSLGVAMFKSKPLLEDELVNAVRQLLGIRTPDPNPYEARHIWAGFRGSAELRGADESLEELVSALHVHSVVADSIYPLEGILLDALTAGDLPVPAFIDCARAFRSVRRSADDGAATAHLLGLRLVRQIECPSLFSRGVRDAITLIDVAKDPRAHSLERIAEGVGRTRAQLGRLFRVETGVSLREWRNAAAIRIAAAALLDRDERFSQIAYKIGYDHHSQFDREFAHVMALGPCSRRCWKNY
jgi:two-component system response regulator RegA